MSVTMYLLHRAVLFGGDVLAKTGGKSGGGRRSGGGGFHGGGSGTGGLPTWVWVVLGLVVIALVVWRFVLRGSGGGDD